MIFDYSDYISSKGEMGIVNYETVEKGKAFFSHKPICPFCKKTIINTVFSKSDNTKNDWLFGSFYQSETVVQCPVCGWWEHKYTNSSDAIVDGIRANDIEINTAILKKYNDNDSKVPIDLLRTYIATHPDKIYGIDAHKMAELVRAVFSDFYSQCKVIPFGKTRDGGKDGLIVDGGGKQTILQVKRRTSPSATEGVVPIRELLGVAMLEENPVGCIFVSTADHFSREAQNAAQRAVALNRVDCFDLYDCKSFLQLLNITKNEPPKIWERLLKLSR